MNRDFWKNKRVVVTGYNGFKGCWMSKWLDMMGATVLGIALEPDENCGIKDIQFSERFQHHIGDVRRRETFEVLKEFQPQIVLHLAAQAIVGIAKEEPAYTFETNVMGTVNLLDELRGLPTVKSIVVVTSDKVYENKELSYAYKETDSLFGAEAYSGSKVCQEMVAKAYYESYFRERETGVATARASNTYGGGDYHFDRLIPYLQKCAFEKEEPKIRNAQSVRPWQFVLDIIRGYLMLAEKMYDEPAQYSGTYNFGPDKEQLYNVGEMADIICGKSVSAERQDFYEAGLLFIDSTKSKEMLQWNPLYDVKTGLKATAKAYKQYFESGNSDDIYTGCIADYQKYFEV